MTQSNNFISVENEDDACKCIISPVGGALFNPPGAAWPKWSVSVSLPLQSWYNVQTMSRRLHVNETNNWLENKSFDFKLHLRTDCESSCRLRDRQRQQLPTRPSCNPQRSASCLVHSGLLPSTWIRVGNWSPLSVRRPERRPTYVEIHVSGCWGDELAARRRITRTHQYNSVQSVCMSGIHTNGP